MSASEINRSSSQIEFESPANRVISQFAPKNKFDLNTSLPDTAFLRQLSVQGRLRYFFKQSTADNEDIITIIPPTGETFFFLRGFFSSLASTTAEVTITNDGSQRGSILLIGNSAAGNSTTVYYDHLDSLVGDGSKSLVINASLSLVQGTIIGWVENTSRIRDVAT